MEKLFDLVVTSLWAPETYLKVLFLAVISPFWWPLARAMYREIAPALIAADNAEPARLAPGEDPFLNIPLASHRARLGRSAVRGAPVAPARGGARRRAF